jgi:hypothetical protein
MSPTSLARKHLLNRVKSILIRRGAPRFQMAIIVFFTASSGILASLLMLLLGMKWMWLRYPLAILIAYAAFLSLIKLWLHIHRKKFEGDFDVLDFTNFADGNLDNMSSFNGFGGGDSGGGGASGSFGNDASMSDASAPSSNGGIIDNLDISFDADELILVFAILGIAMLAIVVAVMAVISAPTLLGEVLIDGVLATGFYHQIKKIERRNWLESVVRRTWLPVLGLLIVITGAALVFQRYLPGADSIGDVWMHLMSSAKQ